jgi:hypothetical protein
VAEREEAVDVAVEDAATHVQADEAERAAHPPADARPRPRLSAPDQREPEARHPEPGARHEHTHR